MVSIHWTFWRLSNFTAYLVKSPYAGILYLYLYVTETQNSICSSRSVDAAHIPGQMAGFQNFALTPILVV